MCSLRYRISLLMAGSSVLLATTFLTSQSQSLSRVETPLQVADALDGVMQPRFLNEEAGFGISRIITINGHESVAYFKPRNDHEKRLMARIQAAGRKYTISFLHCAHVPGKYPGFETANKKRLPGERVSRVEAQPHLTPLLAYQPGKAQPERISLGSPGIAREEWTKVQKLAVDAMPRLKKGKDVETNQGDWLIVMRPVTASQDSCLKCHSGAKAGDTLGVMVYSISKTALPATGSS